MAIIQAILDTLPRRPSAGARRKILERGWSGLMVLEKRESSSSAEDPSVVAFSPRRIHMFTDD